MQGSRCPSRPQALIRILPMLLSARYLSGRARIPPAGDSAASSLLCSAGHSSLPDKAMGGKRPRSSGTAQRGPTRIFPGCTWLTQHLALRGRCKGILHAHAAKATVFWGTPAWQASSIAASHATGSPVLIRAGAHREGGRDGVAIKACSVMVLPLGANPLPTAGAFWVLGCSTDFPLSLQLKVRGLGKAAGTSPW